MKSGPSFAKHSEANCQKRAAGARGARGLTVAVVGGPPVLGVGHDLEDVLLESLNIQRLDLLRIAPARLPGGRVEERKLERRRRRLGELEVLEEGALVRHLLVDESWSGVVERSSCAEEKRQRDFGTTEQPGAKSVRY